MVVHALCSTPIKLNGKTQLPQDPPDPLPDPLPVVVVVGEDVDDPDADVEDDPEDPGGEHVLAPVSWELIQFLKWLT